MTPPSDDSTATTLVLQALEASAAQDSEAAIGFLKQAIARDETAAIPGYLLGAEYAQIGIVERAIAQMTAAVEREPSLHTAWLQLGFLQLAAGSASRAADAWKTLEALDEQNPLHHFGAGMIALVGDRLQEARALLAAGIARSRESDPLARDMEKVIFEIDRLCASSEETAAAPLRHVLIGAYEGDGERS